MEVTRQNDGHDGSWLRPCHGHNVLHHSETMNMNHALQCCGDREFLRNIPCQSRPGRPSTWKSENVTRVLTLCTDNLYRF